MAAFRGSTDCNEPPDEEGGNGVSSHSEPAHNWQATKNSLRERFGFLFQNMLFNDVTFLVGKQRIPAHRLVLSAGSAIFSAMFYGGLATTSAEIQLPDDDPVAFQMLLRYLYSDEVDIGPDTVLDCLYIGKKYAVTDFEARSMEFLIKHLQADNAFTILTHAQVLDEILLANLCFKTIDQSTQEAVSAGGFTDIDMDTLCAVLTRDTLRISESQLFVACVVWAEAACQSQQLLPSAQNKRKVLGKALSLIRFTLMTQEEFAAGPAQSGILSDEEVVAIFMHFTLHPKSPVDYIERPRWCLGEKHYSITRFQEVLSHWGVNAMYNEISFTVSRKIYIVGFGLYGARDRPAYHQVTIEVTKKDQEHPLGQNDTGFSSDGTDNPFRVMFREAIEILPEQIYTAGATIKGPPSYSGKNRLKLVVHETPEGLRTYFKFFDITTSGQIPEIIFCT